MGYNQAVIEVRQTEAFRIWLTGLKDVVVLGGGSKRTQARDIEAAKAPAKEL